jgi:SAM-dependent methyltransferase
MTAAAAPPKHLHRSHHISYFAHMGAVYLFHDIYGFLMEMSPDIVELIDAFSDGADTAPTLARFADRFGDADPAQFIDVLAAHFVLVEVDTGVTDIAGDETEGIWPLCVFKGKWNVWHRRSETLTLWTAWGDRPIQQIVLDANETKMWDAFDGEKRLAELRSKFEPAKLKALVLRLAHSDVQAVKLSMMPASTYAKRPSMAPKYLSSTMPYPSWQPGTPIVGTRDGNVSPTDYYRNDVTDAPAQFDHQETTLSHLLRVPHPALAGRTYGEALIDALQRRNLLPTSKEQPVRVAEIGAGLGYVAEAVMSKLGSLGYRVDYTIVELSKALADAQAARIGAAARWILGDVLATELPAASFDLIVCNEMIGDLPAEQHVRADLGLAEDSGTVDKDKLRLFGKGAELAADWDVNFDDAPEPLYLMTGAFELVEKISRWLAPGGCAVVTEFGEYSQWPKLSTHLDHPELSIHFGHLAQAAKAAGLETKLEFVIDLLDFDRDAKGLATTRSHFRALAAMCDSNGVALPKIGYTPELLDAALQPKLAMSNIGEIKFDRIEDRLMGLVPHEFKALLATKRS